MRPPRLCDNGDGRAFIYHRSIPNSTHRLWVGEWGSQQALEEFERFLKRLRGHQEDPVVPVHREMTVAEMCCKFLQYAQGYYAGAKEFLGVKDSIGQFCSLHAELDASELGPRHLVEVQDMLIGKDLNRKTINQHIGRIKRMIKWCCTREYCPPDTYYKLMCVEGLRKGRSKAREPRKIQPADMQSVQAVLPFLSPPVRAMVQVQYLCGMRPTETCEMKGRYINQEGEIWLYSPVEHKGEWKDLSLVKAIPRAAQEILEPFLSDDPEEYLFKPSEGRQWAYERMRGLKPRKKPKRHRKYNPCYNVSGYNHALKTGFKLARKNGVTAFTPFSPNQLRHTIATEIRQHYGQEKAQVWLGHRHLSTTAIYADRQIQELLSVAKALDQQWASKPAFQPTVLLEPSN